MILQLAVGVEKAGVAGLEVAVVVIASRVSSGSLVVTDEHAGRLELHLAVGAMRRSTSGAGGPTVSERTSPSVWAVTNERLRSARRAASG